MKTAVHAEGRGRGHPDTDSPGRIIAHRGASGEAPENTLSAFRLAHAQGARWIEFDVSLLGDETAVIHHDHTLGRCSNRRGRLARLGAGDLAGIDTGAWFGPGYTGEPLATLEAALDLVAELGLSANLEMKPHRAPPEPMARAVALALERRPWSGRRVLVSSFDHGALAVFRGLMPEQPLAVVYHRPAADWAQTVRELRACSLHIRRDFLTGEILARALGEGVHLRVFTVNEPAAMVPFREAGLAGVITDRPRLFLADPAWAAWSATQAR